MNGSSSPRMRSASLVTASSSCGSNRYDGPQHGEYMDEIWWHLWLESHLREWVTAGCIVGATIISYTNRIHTVKHAAHQQPPKAQTCELLCAQGWVQSWSAIMRDAFVSGSLSAMT